MGRCDCAPVVEAGHRHVDRATPESVRAALSDDKSEHAVPAAPEGGYAQFRACFEGRRSREEVTAEIEAAGLRGMGGAGFPSARKWGFVRAGPKPRHLTVNADEGEPGTFKDRLFLETAPAAVLEGALIAAWAVEADTITIYLRDEYPVARGRSWRPRSRGWARWRRPAACICAGGRAPISAAKSRR